MLLFLTIQIVGVAAMATSQEMFAFFSMTRSSRVPMKLRMNTAELKRQNVRNPVVRDTNFWNDHFIYKKWDQLLGLGIRTSIIGRSPLG